jgi:hypothetical protein
MKEVEEVGDFPHYEILRVLIEASIRDQKAIQASSGALNAAISELRNQAASLPGTLVDQVAHRLVTEIRTNLDNVTSAANRAERHFRQAAEFSIWKLLFLPALCFITSLAGILFYVKLAMPDPRELQKLRIQQAELQDTIAVLERKGGSAEITQCRDSRNKLRPCIRTEEKYGVFGDGQKATYRVIYGY